VTKVIIVGTHTDKLPKKLFQMKPDTSAIKAQVERLITSAKLPGPSAIQFISSTNLLFTNISKLQSRLVEVAEQMSIVTKPVPNFYHVRSNLLLENLLN